MEFGKAEKRTNSKQSTPINFIYSSYDVFYHLREGLKKKKLTEFSVKVGGWGPELNGKFR